MSIYSTEIIDRYRRYGFEYKKNYSNESYLTFTFRSGFFHNAEVIKLCENEQDSADIDSKMAGLTKLGISVKVNEYTTLDKIEEDLFNGFFDVDFWRNRINDEYESYISSIMSIYPNNGEDVSYNYINSKYHIVNQPIQPELDIISDLIERLDSDDSQLILVEAPAGFGKTCTSYELIKKLASDRSKPIPFFTEFSRDRQARVFSHVFIREVDRAFSQVKSSVVEEELKNGRIIMVLDGFDELLSDTQKSDQVEDYENAEPMLETISELLCNKSKIIITSRKSAIFDGATFNEWIDKYNNKFKFIRYRIDPPSTDDWLSFERRELLSNVGIDLDKISNPVLLSYLRFSNKKLFDELCKSPDIIVEHYFKSMLEREQDRQNLYMVPEKQSLILTELAADMCEKDYTSNAKDKVIDFFKNKCIDILEETRKQYKPSERPTIESLSNTLSNHAFFDRSNQGEGRIEFINEFVFGNYIAEDILRSNGDWIASDERFVEPAIISYEPRQRANKEKLWDKLESMSEFLTDSDRLKYEVSMLGKVASASYNQTSIMSLNLCNISVFENFCIKEITFSNCTFNKVCFHIENIIDATFISCKFYDCEIYGDNEHPKSISFLQCYANNNLIKDLGIDDSEEQKSETSELTNFIIERFWGVGSTTIDRLHIPLSSILKASQSQGYTKRDITLEIKKLKKIGILTDANDGGYIAINKDKIAELKDMMGR